MTAALATPPVNSGVTVNLRQKGQVYVNGSYVEASTPLGRHDREGVNAYSYVKGSIMAAVMDCNYEVSATVARAF